MAVGSKSALLLKYGIPILLLVFCDHGVEAQQCPNNMIYQSGYCIPPTSIICPPNSIYLNGVCMTTNSIVSCPIGSYNVNGTCTNSSIAAICQQRPSECIQPTPCLNVGCPYSLICPQSMVMYDATCVAQTIAQCPPNAILQSGYCTQTNTAACCGAQVPTAPVCPAGTYPLGNVCMQIPKIACPTGYHLSGNACVQTQTTTCPIGSYLLNSVCVRNETCPTDTFPYNGICARCPTNTTYEYGRCIQNLPEWEPPKRQIINITLPSQNITVVPQHNNFVNIVNYTNIVNSTNVENITTTLNSSNINNIVLDSISNSSVGETNDRDNGPELEYCCIVTDPKKCSERNGRQVCYRKKRHVCGKECAGVEEIIYPQKEPQIPTVQVQKRPVFRYILTYPNVTQAPVVIPQPVVIQQQPQYSYVPQQPQYQYVMQQPQYQYVQQPMVVQQPATPTCSYQSSWPFMSCPPPVY